MAYHAINHSLRSRFNWLIWSNKHFLTIGHRNYSSVLNLKYYSTTTSNIEVPYAFNLTNHYKNPQNLAKIPYTKPKKSAVPQDGIEGYFSNYDIIIIGGGVMGCSAAFWLGQHGLKILVVERDPTVRMC